MTWVLVKSGKLPVTIELDDIGMSGREYLLNGVYGNFGRL